MGLGMGLKLKGVRQMSIILNPIVHSQLSALGYWHEHVEAEFDDGDPESGPGTWGHDAFDRYTGPDHYLYADETGILHVEPRDHVLEAWIEEHGHAYGYEGE
jgi:hypothetical protein